MNESKKLIYLISGYLSLGLGIIGLVIPIMPTTPFIVLAAYCFAKSNKKMREKLVNHKIFGPIILDWEKHKGIRRHVKIKATLVVVTSILITLYFLDFEPKKTIIISTTILIVFSYIWTRPEPKP